MLENKDAKSESIWSLATIERAWESVSMDLIIQLPVTARGHSAIAVYVDRLTKLVFLVLTTSNVSLKDFANMLFREVFANHGLPKDIVSDRDPRFTSEFFTELCKRLDVEQKLLSTFHPQSYGQNERMNCFIEDILRAYVSPAQDDGNIHLSLVQFTISDAYQ